jgi:hypothetical protein
MRYVPIVSRIMAAQDIYIYIISVFSILCQFIVVYFAASYLYDHSVIFKVYSLTSEDF